jgi:hypothetical protein
MLAASEKQRGGIRIMNWDAIGAVGEWAGAIVVVATLFYLAGQVKQSQRMARAVAQRDLLLRVSEWTRMTHNENQGTFDKFVMGLRDYDTAEPLTQMHIDKHLSEFVFIAEAALNMRKDGFFSDGTWAGIEGAVLALLRTPGGQQWWAYSQHFIGSEIVEHLKMELQKVDPKIPTFLQFTPAYLNRLKELDAQRSEST